MFEEKKEMENYLNDGSKFYCMLLSWPVMSNHITSVFHCIVTHVTVLWYMTNADTNKDEEDSIFLNHTKHGQLDTYFSL